MKTFLPQQEILDRLKHEKRGMVLGGDGRADSPGHYAKFGSYTLIELGSELSLMVQVSSCISILTHI